MEFSERLKNLRKQAHLTQVDVAEKLGISQPAYASWERGIKKPTQENLVKIAQILNVSIDYLVGNSDGNLKEDELDNVELLFRMNSNGLTEEEKDIFKKELIEFMEERKKAFKNGKIADRLGNK
jgi:putative transcriptional regulator